MGKPVSLEYYVSKFGQEVGVEKWRRCEVSRENQNRKKERLGKSVAGLEQEVKDGTLIKCLGCNAFLTVIQSTHFDKCNIKSRAEYISMFPNSPLICREMRENLILNKNTVMMKVSGVGISIEISRHLVIHLNTKIRDTVGMNNNLVNLTNLGR